LPCDNGGYVLLLQRREPGAAIRASFACSKAHSAVEQAICASPTLAGYDRSVAAAYRRAGPGRRRRGRCETGAARMAEGPRRLRRECRMPRSGHARARRAVDAAV